MSGCWLELIIVCIGFQMWDVVWCVHVVVEILGFVGGFRDALGCV